MADEQIVTNIVANADFSGLISDLARVTAALNNLQNQAGATNKALSNQISVMNRQFGDTLRSTGQFTTHFVTIGSDVEKFGKNLDAGRGKLRDFYGAWQGYHKQAGGLVRDLAKQQVQLQNSILQPLGRNADGMMRFAVQVPRGLDEVKNKTALAKQELMIMNRVVQEGANQLINWGKNTQWAGRQLTVGLTVPIAAFGKAAADAFREADEQLVRLTKVYGDVAGTSSQELGKVRKEVAATARDLAASMGASFKDTLALSADIAATGQTGDQLLGSIRETTRLAILGEVDRQDAMKATLAIQSAFKQNTDELSESINFLNAVENQTSTSLNDLVEAIPKAGPVIKGLGGSVQDLALYLTAMREGGINASEGANALKSALASLINPTDVAVAKFKGFGIDLLGIVQGNAGNVTNTLLALQGALDSLDPLAKQQAIEQLFGKFQFSRMNALFENLGKQGSQTLKVLDLMKASSAELSDLAGRELSAVTESASGKYRRALAELKADLATVGEKFLTINTYLIKFVDKIVDFANNLPGPIKAILGFLGGITAIAGPLIMLTGVLGNFFGYIIKGVSHFKALFKGAEGWKLLTPEILAANNAGDLVEQTFYSDAKAAAVLNQALRDLTAQYDALAIRAQSGAISINPVLTNITAQAQAQGLSRVVDPTHPLAGEYGTRASAHMVPRRTDQPRTIFGLVPSSIPVNAAIGENPMIYAEGDMPRISGVTSVPSTRTIGGVKQTVDVSTGIVASEAARHHAYTATLAMQSQAELKALKQTIATTGTVSTEFMQTFDDILPITSRITQNAAAQSAVIVAELQQGKITAAAARERIIALNLAIERELGAATTAYATSVGRSIDLMHVPGTTQPVQTTSGKSNMREMFKARTGGIFTRIAEALRVRTSGAGYNTETTKLRRFNTGGRVENFGPNKTTVTGDTSINYDDRLGSVPLGGYVLNQGASLDPANRDLVALAPYTFNGGGKITAALTPGETVFGPNIHNVPGLAEALDAANYGYNIGGRIRASKNAYGNPLKLQRTHITDDLSGLALLLPQWLNLGVRSTGSGLTGSQIAAGIRETISGNYNPNSLLTEATKTLGGDTRQANRRLSIALSELIAKLESPEYSGRLIGGSLDPLGFEKIAKDIYRPALRGIRIDPRLAGGTANLFAAVSQIFTRRAGEKITLDDAIDRGIVSGKKTGSKTLGEIIKRKDGRLSWVSQNRTIGAVGPRWARNTNLFTLLTTASGVSGALKVLRRNMGGPVPGYVLGGGIKQNALTKSMFMRALGIGFGKKDGTSEWGVSSLSLGMGARLFGKSGLRPNTQNLLYDALSRKLADARPYGYYKSADGKLLRGIEESELDVLIRDAAHSLLTEHRKQLSPIDIDIIKKKFDPFGKGTTPVTSTVRKTVFGYNKGGRIGGGLITKQRRNYGQSVQFLGNPGIGAQNSAIAYSPGHGAAGMTPGRMNTQGSFMAGMGLQTAGYMASQSQNDTMRSAATPLMLAGTAMQFAPMLKPLTTAMKSVKTLGQMFTGMGSIIVRVGIAARTAFAFLTGPIGLTILAVTAAAAVFMKLKKNAEDAGKANRLAFGGTKESFASVGIKNYTNLEDRLKAVNKQLELNKAKVLSTYNSYAKGGPSGITLTIEELDAAIESAKKNQKDYVEAFNNIDSSEVANYAASLKAQFIAMGLSASEAANQIYAIVKASNKASDAIAAVSSEAFKTLQKNTDGIKFLATALRKEINSQDFNAEEFARGLDTLLNSIMSYQSSLVGTIDKTGELTGTVGAIVDEADALAAAMKQVNSITGTNKELSDDQLKNLKDQSIVYTAILGTNESLRSITAKILMYQMGLGEIVDLASMGKKEAIEFASNLTKVQNALNSITESSDASINPLLQLKLLRDEVKKSYDQADKLAKKAKKVDDEYYNNKIKNIDKEIDKIKEQTDAKLKLLEVEQQKANYDDDLRKAKLDYEQALASGDMVAAAEAQANVQKLIEDRQRALTTQNIQDRAAAEIKKLEDQKKKLQEENDKLNTQYNKIQANFAEKQMNLADLDSKISEIENIVLRTRANGGIISDIDRKAIDNIMKELKDKGGIFKEYADKLMSENKPLPGEGGQPPKSFAQTLVDKLNIRLGEDNKTFSTAVDKFDEAVEKFLGKTDVTNPGVTGKGGVKAQATAVAGTKTGSGDSTKYYDAAGNPVTKEQYNSMPVEAASGKEEFIIPSNTLKNKVFFDRLKAQREFFDAFDGKGQVKVDGYTYFANGTVKKGKNIVGQWYADLPGSIGKVKSYNMGGMIQHFGPGGGVSGPGTATSDSIPAYLSNGEYVIKASSVDKYGVEMFDALNAQKLAVGGRIKDPRVWDDKKEDTYYLDRKIKNRRFKDNMGGSTYIPRSSVIPNERTYLSHMNLANGGMIPKFGFGGFVKGLFTKMPQIMGSAAIWQTMEELEKVLSLKYGADKKDSDLQKWGRGFARFGWDALQGGLSGLTFGPGGAGAGAVAGTIEGLIGWIQSGKNFGVKGGNKADDPNFDPKKALDAMSLKGSLGQIALTAGLSVPFGMAGNWIGPRVSGKLSPVTNKIKAALTKKSPSKTSPVKSQNIQVGDDTYQSFTIGKDKTRFTFKGLEGGSGKGITESDLSALTSMDGSLFVVPTTPQGLIQAALKLKPKDKNLLQLLENFKSKKYGAPENDLLDAMTASSYIGQDGALLEKLDTEGLALVIAHLSGDSSATAIIKSKKIALDSLLKKEASGATTQGTASKFDGPLEPDQVPVIHSTQHDLQYDKDGNIVIMPAGHYRVGEGQLPKGAGTKEGMDVAVPRSTVHTTLYGSVADHLYSQWSPANKKIVSTLAGMLDANGNPYSINPTDTWWSRSPGQPLIFPKDTTAVILPFTDEIAYAEELVKRGIIKKGQHAPIAAADPNKNEVLHLTKKTYSDAELQEIADLMYKEGQELIVQEGKLLTQMRSYGENYLLEMGTPNEYLDRIATQLAKKKLNIEGGSVSISGHELTSNYANKHVRAIGESLGVPQLQHSGSTPAFAEMPGDFYTRFKDRGGYAYSDPLTIDMLRFLALNGHFPTPRISPVKPRKSILDSGWDDDDAITGATGGFVKDLVSKKLMSSSFNIPKFENGINMVPADMLAMLHKNEAVVPANMNPFNPNANNATMGGAQYNVNVTLNGANMDPNDVAKVITRELKLRESMNGRSLIR